MFDFSIIIPAYNVESYIVGTLESICRNNLENTEIIIIENGSQDKTRELIEQYIEQMKIEHYKIIYQENKGVSCARNIGIDHAQGDYLIFCDGDDLCEQNMIDTISILRENDVDMLVWRYQVLQNGRYEATHKEFMDKVFTNENALRSFLLDGYRIRMGSFAVKKEFLDNAGIRFTEDCAIAEDMEFIYKCLAKAEKVTLLNDILFTYLKRAGSAMYTFDLRRFQAPDAMERVRDFVEENTPLKSDRILVEYICNGLYLLHSIYSFDACIQYLNSWKSAHFFLEAYYEKFNRIENRIRIKAKEVQMLPPVITPKKLRLFSQSRRLYVYYYVLKNFIKKGGKKRT